MILYSRTISVRWSLSVVIFILILHYAIIYMSFICYKYNTFIINLFLFVFIIFLYTTSKIWINGKAFTIHKPRVNKMCILLLFLLYLRSLILYVGKLHCCCAFVQIPIKIIGLLHRPYCKVSFRDFSLTASSRKTILTRN